MQATCQVCENEFEAKRVSAKFCSDRCRQRNQRGADGSSGSLVDSVTRDLTAAGRADSFAGQLAIELARQMTASGATGISSLSKELRTVMSSAMEGVTPPSAEGDPDDEVSKAREARERKTRQAASGA